MLQGYSQTQFFYGQVGGVFYDPAFAGIIDRDLAVATRTIRGGTAYGIYPFNRYRRVEVYGGINQYVEEFDGSGPRAVLAGLPGGELRPRAVQQRHADAARRGVRAGDDDLPRVRPADRQHDAAGLRGRAEDRQHADAPDHGRRRAAATTASAAPACWRCAPAGFKSWGDNPSFLYFGGNSEMRGYDYLSFAGQNAFFLNAELRFPLIEAMATPIGILGGVRAAFFAGLGGASWSP